MQFPTGHVVSVPRSGSPSRIAVVEIEAPVACRRCAEGKGCGAGVFADRGTRRVEATVPVAAQVEVGDIVAIDLSAHDLLPAAMIVYGWPLMGAVAGALLAQFGPWSGDAAVAAGALIGLFSAGLLAHRRLARADCVARFRPVILSTVDVRPSA